MSEKVPADKIEGLVGASRHKSLHLGRAVSAEQMVYVLHSQDCLNAFEDLRDCPFSLALDDGIDVNDWIQDEAVVLGIAPSGRLLGGTVHSRKGET